MFFSKCKIHLIDFKFKKFIQKVLIFKLFLENLQMNKEYHIIGLMSGTSLDGVDLVKCTFVNNGDWSFKIKRFETINYSKYWREKLAKLHTKSSKEIRD